MTRQALKNVPRGIADDTGDRFHLWPGKLGHALKAPPHDEGKEDTAAVSELQLLKPLSEIAQQHWRRGDPVVFEPVVVDESLMIGVGDVTGDGLSGGLGGFARNQKLGSVKEPTEMDWSNVVSVHIPYGELMQLLWEVPLPAEIFKRNH